jgi:hypothetical protein
MNGRKFYLLFLVVSLTAAFTMSAVFAQESTETPTAPEATESSSDTSGTDGEMVACDSDLIMLLYVAERFFDYSSFDSVSTDVMVDFDSIDKGQYTPWFDSIDSSRAFAFTDDDRSSINDMLMMSDADFEAQMAGSDNMLVMASVDESDECAALRASLRRFFAALAMSDVDVSGMGHDMGSTDTDTDTDSGDTDTNTDSGSSAGAITVELTGATEVPGPGDEDASGTATVYLRTDSNEVCVDISVQNIALPATAAHIHQAPAGESGPPVVPLNAPNESGVSNTCAVVDAALMQAMIDTPQNFYVNVHNNEFPDGAARGQLTFASSGSDSGSTGSDSGSSDTGSTDTDTGSSEGAIAVELTGAAEVPGPGDEDGSGTATIYLRTDTNEVCVDISVQSDVTLPATAAHIHQAPAGEAGPPVVPLNAPDASGLSSTCAVVDAALMQAMIDTPENFYVNVHTSDFPDGAIRGQLP